MIIRVSKAEASPPVGWRSGARMGHIGGKMMGGTDDRLGADESGKEHRRRRTLKVGSQATPSGLPAFACPQCAASVPQGSTRCPGCRVLLVNDSEGSALDQGAANPTIDPESPLSFEEALAVLKQDQASCIHFEVRSGTIVYLQRT